MPELNFDRSALRSAEHVFVTGADVAPALKERAATKLQRYLDEGIVRAANALETIERDAPSDTVLSTRVLGVQPSETGLDLVISPPAKPGVTLDDILERHDERRALHRNAIAQATQRVGMPLGYANDLAETQWGKALLAQILTTHFTNDPQRVLVRCVRDTARAFLSDSYRRLDARPVVGAFVSACSDIGAVISDGLIDDLRMRITAVMPTVMWVNGDPCVFGLSVTTSDFGRGRLLLSAFTLRLACLNGATSENFLKQVHLGGKLPEDLKLSDRTYALDTETTASAVNDIVKSHLTPEALGVRAQRIVDASAVAVDPKAAFKDLKKTLSKQEHDDALDVFMFGNADKVPDGANAYRLSQAIAYVAGQSKTAERRLDLERLAGAILDAPSAKLATLDASLDEELRAAA